MNQSPANRAALRRLAIEPMRAAGLDYAEQELVSDMLARMNYYPSLVQVFGRQIVESFGRRPRAGVAGPRWKLDREGLFEGAAAERIADQIRDRFQLTLNLDVRYDCIARSIALHLLEATGGDSKVLAQGLTATEIHRITHWPKALAQPAITDFEELLEELVDLGILSGFPDRRYGLRNAQVAQMLGRQDELVDALLRLDDREDDPAYDAALFFRLLAPQMPGARAPLSDRDLDRLFDPSVPGVRLIRSRPVIVGGDVAGRILAAAHLWLPGGRHTQTASDDAHVRRAIDKVKTGPAVLVINGAWSPALAAQLGRQPKVERGDVLPVWCGAPDTAPGDGVIVFDAGPWSEAMLRHWLAELRRGDRVIWAEEHLSPARDGFAGYLAVVLAVELCAWRLDLAAVLVRAGLDDLADPAAWLSRRTETPINGEEPACPLALLGSPQPGELLRRIWKAQLTTLFPEIESRRLEIVEAHRSQLRVNEHLRGLGVVSVDEIELGALRFQLRGSLQRHEAERLDVPVRARNALAHRQPVRPEDALHLLRV